jgi:cytoskeletal protein CcmA (bactofilin family)
LQGGQIVAVGDLGGTINVNGEVQGGTIASSGAISGNLTIGGPLRGQIVSVGNITGNVTIKGPLQSGRIATLGSVLGNLSVSGSIDSQSAITASGSIGSTSSKTTFSSGDILGIVAAEGSINVGKIGKTTQALYYKANSPDATVIDAIFQGLTPLSPTDLFDKTTPLDLYNLSRILVNLSLLKVQNGKLVILPH